MNPRPAGLQCTVFLRVVPFINKWRLLKVVSQKCFFLPETLSGSPQRLWFGVSFHFSWRRSACYLSKRNPSSLPVSLRTYARMVFDKLRLYFLIICLICGSYNTCTCIVNACSLNTWHLHRDTTRSRNTTLTRNNKFVRSIAQ